MNVRSSHSLQWLVLPCLLLARGLASDETGIAPEAVYRSNVREVRLAFYATDQQNRAVDQLTGGDIAVVDNERVVRRFRSFARTQETRLQIVLLVDTSESVVPGFQREIADVVQLISRTDGISADDVSLLSFGGTQPKVICQGDCQGPQARAKLSTAEAADQTPLYDALVFAAGFIAQHHQPGARPVIVVFSDGEDTISRSSAEDAIDAALGSEAVLYAADVGASHLHSDGAAALRSMSEATGGRFFPLRENGTSILSAVLEDLHSSYVVTYQLPDRETGFHAVRIFPTHNLNLQLRCRSGYYYQERAR